MDDGAARVVAACRALTGPWTLLIDGRSGAGKSTLADAVVAATGARLVRLDDLYPGWDGLAQGVEQLRRDLLGPRARRGIGRWQRWDWGMSAVAEWHTIEPTDSLVVEGCGALWGTSGSADLGIWVEATDAERRRRARLRDGDRAFRHWDRWAAQEDTYIAAEQPADHADLVVDDPGPRTSGPR